MGGLSRKIREIDLDRRGLVISTLELLCIRYPSHWKVLEKISTRVELKAVGQGLQLRLQRRRSAEGHRAVPRDEMGGWKRHVEQVTGGQDGDGRATNSFLCNLLQIRA